LPECEVFVTLEPCAMCAMALLHARVKRVVYGARDPKAGAAGSVIDVFGTAALNHHTAVDGGVLADAAGEVLRAFFAERRERYKQRRSAGAAAAGEGAAAVEPIPAGESLEMDPLADKAER
jgi:tRNA(adenine34) deaminase